MLTQCLFSVLVVLVGIFNVSNSNATQFHSETNQATTLTITTLNVRWYGLGGEMNGFARDEFRAPWIKELLENNFSNSDVFVFQEIVDTKSLIDDVVPRTYDCITYSDKPGNLHQYVVACVKPHLRLLKETDDNNYEIEGVQLGSSGLRPALSAVVATASGRKLAHIIGVHLKAFPAESATRENQAEVIADRISEFNDSLPIIITGDFNSYSKSNNNRSMDDTQYIDRAFNSSNKRLKLLSRANQVTYQLGDSKNQFDHFWVSDFVTVTGSSAPWVACANSRSPQTRFANIDFYNRFVSDHCPVTTTLRLPSPLNN